MTSPTITDDEQLRCTEPDCEKPGPYPDLRAYRAHEASHRRRQCPHCGEGFAPQGYAHHVRSCAGRTAAERLEAGDGRRHRPQAAGDLSPALGHLPGWLAGLTADADLAGRLLEFVTAAYQGGTLAAGMAVVAGPSWGPHLVKLTSLPSVAAGHRDAAVLVLDAGHLAHDLTLELELAG